MEDSTLKQKIASYKDWGDILYSAQLGCMAQLVLLCQMSHENTTAEAKYNPKKGGERDRSSIPIKRVKITHNAYIGWC